MYSQPLNGEPMQPIERKALYINGEQIDCTVFSLIATAVIFRSLYYANMITKKNNPFFMQVRAVLVVGKFVEHH